jgi:hypothetical protein
MGCDFLNQLDFLNTRCVINASLEDATPVSMSSNRDAVFSYRIKDELAYIS